MGTYMLSSLLRQLMKERGMYDQLDESRIRSVWLDCVGENLSDVVQVVSFFRGELSLRTHSSAWRMEIRYREKKIIESLNIALGENIVKTLKVR